ncbi:hypothetical protein [Massilia niabensis]|uniref:Uncharacterized protein n=1 Tax=Massilia niabensis TaxID=544910 RepID=A0ABW0L475_9BURK
MKYLNLFFAAMLAMSAAFASPGAHGPNGEHLDGQTAATGAVATVPRIETFTEAFELLGHLSGGELSIMIDRYETNEPVLGGDLEVQYKDLKAMAKFHADLGDYAVDDPKLLAAISKPGTHALLFTLVAGEESDLLEGTLTVAEAADEHGHEHGVNRWLLAALAAAVLAVAAVFVARRRRQRKKA